MSSEPTQTPKPSCNFYIGDKAFYVEESLAAMGNTAGKVIGSGLTTAFNMLCLCLMSIIFLISAAINGVANPVTIVVFLMALYAAWGVYSGKKKLENIEGAVTDCIRASTTPKAI